MGISRLRNSPFYKRTKINERNFNKSGKFNFKINQKFALLHQFWKTIDANYFDKANSDPENDLAIILTKTNKPANPKPVSQFTFDSPAWIPSKIAEITNKVFKKRAFEIGEDGSTFHANFENFLAQFWTSYLTYGRLMRLCSRNELTCEKCVFNLFLIFESKFKLNFERNSDPQKRVENLRKETDSLKATLNSAKCEVCQKRHRRFQTWKRQSDFKAANQARITHLLQLSNTRKQQSVSMQPNLNVFKEVTLQKDYLAGCLIFLERKLLAGSIFKIHFARKNDSVELLLSKNNLKVSVKLKELLLIDKFRENSLFRIGKTAFKCHNSFFSYNVF